MGDKIRAIQLDKDDDDWYEHQDSDIDSNEEPYEAKHRQLYSKFIDTEALSESDQEHDYPSGDSQAMDQDDDELGSEECDNSSSDYDIHPCDNCGKDGTSEFNGYVFCDICYTRLSSNNDITGGRRLPGELRVHTAGIVGKETKRESRLLTKLRSKQIQKKV